MPRVSRLLVLLGLAVMGGCSSTTPPGSLDGGDADSATTALPLNLQIHASATTGAAPLTVAFSLSSDPPIVEPAHYTWTLGNGISTEVAAPRNTFLDASTVTVQVSVTDATGAMGSATLELSIADSPASDLKIDPAPVRFVVGDAALPLTGTWTVVVDDQLENGTTTAERVAAALRQHTGVAATVVGADSYFTTNGSIDAHPPATVYLMRHDDPRIKTHFATLGESVADYPHFIGALGFGQGYLAFVDDGRVFILGESGAGVFYGAITLSALVEQAQGPLPRFAIVDYPDLQRRIYYPLSHENPSDVTDPAPGLALLEQMARAKMNGAFMISGSMTGHVHDVFAPYVRAAKERFIRPALATRIPFDVSCALEGFRVVDEPFTFGIDTATAQRPDNPGFVNADFETGTLGAAPPGWQQANTSAALGQWVLANGDAGGARSASLTRDASNIDGRPMLYQTVAVPPGSWYLAEFRVKTANTTNAGSYQFLLDGLDSTGARVFYREAVLVPKQDGVWSTVPMHMSAHSKIAKINIWIRPSPGIRGTLFVDQVKLTRMSAALANVLLGSGHTLRVTGPSGTPTYVEGQDYSVTTTGSPPSAGTLDQLGFHAVLHRLGAGALSAGASVLVSYDYIYAQDKSTVHNQSPFVDCGYDAVAATFSNLATQLTTEGLAPSDADVFIGQDEIRGFNMDARALVANLDNASAMALHLNRMIAATRQAFPQARVYMWSDMLDPHQNGGDPQLQSQWGGKDGLTMPAAFLLDNNDIELVPWWYDTVDELKVMRESPAFFNRAGLRVAGGAGGNLGNIQYWSGLLRGTANDFVGHSIFEATLTKTEAIAAYGAYAWRTYAGSIAAVTASGSFELCNGQDDDGDGMIDEDYDLMSDPDHCGSCPQHCDVAHGWGACVAGQCAVGGCLPGFRDANQSFQDGCEASP